MNLDKLETAQLPLTIDDAVNARLAALDPRERQLLEHAAAMGSVFWTGAFVALGRAGREPPELWGTEVDDDAVALADDARRLVERDYVLKLPDSTFPGLGRVHLQAQQRARDRPESGRARAAAQRYHQVIADWMDHQETVRASDEYIAMLAEHREKGGDAHPRGPRVPRGRRRGAPRATPSRKAGEYYQKGLDAPRRGARRAGASTRSTTTATCSSSRAASTTRSPPSARCSTLAYRLDLRAQGRRGAQPHRPRATATPARSTRPGSHLTTALALFEAAGDERGVASSIDDIGKLHWLKGEYEPGARARCATASRAAGGSATAARSRSRSNNLGLVLQDSGEFKQALEAFEQVARHPPRNRRSRRRRASRSTTSAASPRISATSRAPLALFEEALEVARQIGDRNRIALVLTNIGECHYRSGDPAEAIEVLQQAEELCDELGDKLGLAEALRGLGKALHAPAAISPRRATASAARSISSPRCGARCTSASRSARSARSPRRGGWGSSPHQERARVLRPRRRDLRADRQRRGARAHFKVYARFLIAEANDANDTQLVQEAASMEARADEIFARLRLASPVAEGAPQGRFGRPQMPSRVPDLK